MLAEIPLPHDVGDFRLMDRQVVLALRQLPERQRFMKGIFAWLGFKQAIGIRSEQSSHVAGFNALTARAP